MPGFGPQHQLLWVSSLPWNQPPQLCSQFLATNQSLLHIYVCIHRHTYNNLLVLFSEETWLIQYLSKLLNTWVKKIFRNQQTLGIWGRKLIFQWHVDLVEPGDPSKTETWYSNFRLTMHLKELGKNYILLHIFLSWHSIISITVAGV